MAFVCSGLVLPADEVPEGVTADLNLAAGLAYVQSPAQDAASEAGLDHLDWAEDLARKVSCAVRIAYIEAEFFGGTGSQAAVGFESGVARFGPLRTQMPLEDREGFAVVRDQDEMAINAVLRWLGVHRTELRDEFDIAEINRCRGLWDPNYRGWE